MLALCVALVAIVVFARTSAFEFLVWDDDQHVSANARLDPPTLESLASFWRAPFLALYVPASYTLFWLQAWVTNGPDPRVYHAVSVLLHGANAALVVLLLARLGARPLGAALGGLFFALHPLQVESVAWISEQRGLLAALFGLGALCAYASARPGLRRDLAAGLLLILALLAKPSAVVVPALALVLEVTVLRRGTRFAAPRLAFGMVAAVACLLVTKGLQQDESVHEIVPLLGRPLVAADAIEFYVRKLFAPVELAPDYGRRPSLVLAHGVDGTLVATCAGLAALLAVPALRRQALVPLALFVTALAPVLGLVPFGHQDLSTVADRYAYLALLGPAYLLARAWPAGSARAAAIAASAGLLALCALSFAQSAYWRSTDSIFEHTLAVNRRSWIAHTNRGLVLQNRGDLVGAQSEYEAAIGAKPDHARALNNLGILLVQRGRGTEGEALVRRAIEADPRYARPHMNLAAILGNLGRFDEAEQSARRAVELAPEDPTMHTTLGNVHLRQGRAGEALLDFESARRLRPRDVEAWLGLGLAQEALGDSAAARASLTSALDRARERAPGRVRHIEAQLARLAGR
ncbi:MAG: tetratricopeptide repeat protein [Planctomycetota bacterium]|nr:tetratricopeptide repeat protein [Planctomycetota bacterium]